MQKLVHNQKATTYDDGPECDKRPQSRLKRVRQLDSRANGEEFMKSL
jgi:hypothetical protein